MSRGISKKAYNARASTLREALLETQFELEEKGTVAVIILLAGPAASGKGNLGRRLNQWMDPRRLETWAFLAHSEEEDQRPPMWRYWRVLPPKGRIAIFFEAWYAHPMRRYVRGEIDEAGLDMRTEEIKRFETMLARENVLVLKFWLDLSEAEQGARLEKLAADPATNWKVTAEDLIEHDHYAVWARIADRTRQHTDTALAPWRIVPASDERSAELSVAETIHEAIRTALDTPARDEREPPLAVQTDNPLDRQDLSKRLRRADYRVQLAHWQGRLSTLARDSRLAQRSVVLAFEGHDAAGKGGTIRRVAAALDARHYRIHRIGAPSADEAAQPYLWRFWMRLPGHGNFAIFDRSWYGRVLVERVEGFATTSAWCRAYDEINDFEANLVRNGVILAKFWLSISKDEQLARFQARQETGFKRFKMTDEDWRNRDKWDAYHMATGDMIALTSTEAAPWTLIEAEDKYYARVQVLRTICERLEESL